LHLTSDETKTLVDCFFDVIYEMIVEEKDNVHIEIRNFGTFDVLPTKKRQNARNPKTKEKVVIPARKRVVFKPSKKIKNELYKKKTFS
tara:strand:+ start:1041 stop:1304 length:264 start_codon:yes stop_codon:yes gene_type:complete